MNAAFLISDRVCSADQVNTLNGSTNGGVVMASAGDLAGGETDHLSPAIDMVDRLRSLLVGDAHVKERLRDMRIEYRNCVHAYGVDLPQVEKSQWT